MSDVTEFTYLDTEEMHLVGAAANGFDALLAKARDALEETMDETTVKACGVDGCAVCADALAKGKLKAKQRHALDDSEFAFPKERKEPLTDASHVRNAMARFNQVEGVSDEERAEAKRRIRARAKELGIEVSDDNPVAEKQTAPDKDLHRSEAESQTREVGDAEPAGPSPDNEDHGEAKHVAFPHGPSGDGEGDTAPDKDTHQGEAESQTHDNIEGNPQLASVTRTKTTWAYKAEGDGTGDTAPDKDLHEDEAESQTRDDVEGNANKTAGDSAWEAHDANLAAEIGELAGQLEEREKAEGTAGKALGTEPTIQPTVSKEIEDMTHDELIKLLDERDAARRADRKAQKKAEAKKAAKEAAKAAEEAAKADGEEATKAVDERIDALQKEIDALSAKRPTINALGPTAMLRGPQGESALKAFDERVQAAEARLEKAVGEYDRQQATTELEAARRARLMAKMVARDNAQRDGRVRPGRFGPNSTDLFGGTSLTLPEDHAVKGI